MEKQKVLNRVFKYGCIIEPIHEFYGCMDSDDFLENMIRHTRQPGLELSEDERMKILAGALLMNWEAVEKTVVLCAEMPERVLFFAVPSLDIERFSPCAITCTSSHCCLFTSNCDFAAIFANRNGGVRIW